jgi:transposase
MSTRTKKDADLTAVRELLISLLAEGRSDEAIEAVLAILSELREQNTELMLRLAQLQRERSGRRSEKLDAQQLSLMLELVAEQLDDTEDEDDEGLEIETEAESHERPRRKPRRRRPSKELPREVIRHDLSASERVCTSCGDEMASIGDDVSELVELIPAQFVVQEHHRAKYACSRCKDEVRTAAGPAKLIEKGLAGVGLLAHVVQSKYDDHLPLNRLQEIYRRGGFEVGVSTLCDWVGAVAEEVKPIVDRIIDKIASSHVVQTDGSGLKVLDRDDSEGIRKGTMWCYVGDRSYVAFRYSRTGTGEDGPWTHLASREGYIQADAASVFDRLFNGQCANATEVGCWAHARRRFHKLKDTEPVVAYPLKLIGKLYRVEHSADGRELSHAQRLSLRQSQSAGILDRLKRWLVKTAASEPPESALHKACAYSLNHWEALTRFLEDGRLSLDNNLCELQIRSLAVGRKNYLFAGSDSGAERGAILYSLLRTCALQGVDTYAYLKDILEKLADGWPANRIDELQPDAWAATQQANEPAEQTAAA